LYKVRIDKFEGPFDLLVYLIESARMDIYDIKVAEITEQYIDYLKEMDELDVEVGSEFIVLAAVLIRLKSRMLLPRIDENGDPELAEDPRLELANRLAEYIRTRKIAEMLQAREEYYLNVHAKPAEDLSEYIDSPDEILKADGDQFEKAFLLFLEKKKKVADVRKRYQRIRRQRASIEDRIQYMSGVIERKLGTGSDIPFTELIPEDADRYDVTLSFVSLLEMIRVQDIDAEQKELFGEIRVSRKNGGGNNV
jgi:segregation and condensation protein A